MSRSPNNYLKMIEDYPIHIHREELELLTNDEIFDFWAAKIANYYFLTLDELKYIEVLLDKFGKDIIIKKLDFLLIEELKRQRKI